MKPRLQTSSKVIDFHPTKLKIHPSWVVQKSPFLLSLSSSSSSSSLVIVVVVSVSEELF
jgi:hypothetical protein